MRSKKIHEALNFQEPGEGNTYEKMGLGKFRSEKARLEDAVKRFKWYGFDAQLRDYRLSGSNQTMYYMVLPTVQRKGPTEAWWEDGYWHSRHDEISDCPTIEEFIVEYIKLAEEQTGDSTMGMLTATQKKLIELKRRQKLLDASN